MQREGGREEEKLPRSSYAKQDIDLSRCRGFQSNIIPPFKIDNKKRLMRHNEGKTDERCDISRERKRRSELRLSDVQEAGSKKASSNTCY